MISAHQETLKDKVTEPQTCMTTSIIYTLGVLWRMKLLIMVVKNIKDVLNRALGPV